MAGLNVSLSFTLPLLHILQMPCYLIGILQELVHLAEALKSEMHISIIESVG